MAAKNASRPCDGEAFGMCRRRRRMARARGGARPASRSGTSRPAQKAVHDRVVLFGLAGAGGVNQSPAGGHDRRSLLAASPVARRRAPPVRSAVLRHLMSGSRLTVPRPEHGASSSTRSKATTNGGAAVASALDDPDLSGAGSSHRPREQIDPARHARHRRRATPWPSIAAAIAIVLPPGEAHASSTRSPGRAPA